MLHAKSEDASMNNNGDMAYTRFSGFSPAAGERMRIGENETCSEHPGHETVLMVLEPSPCDVPVLRKRAEKKNNNKNNKN